MTHFSALLLLPTLLPLCAMAQTPTLELSRLRSVAQIEGSVEVKVTTRASAAATLRKSPPTSEEQIAIERAQRKILIQLVSSGLVVGNEISVLTDGSFTMRVLPAALDRLASRSDIAELTARH